MAVARERRKSFDERAQVLNLWLGDCPPIHWLAEKLGAQPLVVTAAGLLWLLLFVLWGFMGELVCKVFGNLYPMYASFQALEDGDHDEVSCWLTYWVTFAALTLVEAACGRALAWLPFYHLARLAFGIWLFMPATRGAQAAYGWILRPLLRRHRPQIDAAIDKSVQKVHDTLSVERLRETLRSRAAEATGVGSVEELVAEELKKAAAKHFVQPAHVAARSEMLGPAGVTARTRTASPRPSPTALRKVQAPAEEDKENAQNEVF
eukprot:TRINITY_DN78187_c0_g1_i1.p1 TRINITY_DN78187_c0_g1~~TRINITY_DN78187_c0_g1_i1.p1  ORF type:complete len:263 (+),score=54.68 TRINITY_DN78187_c0_g1_i1:32-820(+)